MTSFSTLNKRFQITLAGLFIGLFCGLLGVADPALAAPGNESGTKGTGSAGRSVVLHVL